MTLSGKRIPNAEQSKAIVHSGGKLLSAGAGSGKTFVLVEHIIFLLDQFRVNIPRDDWSIKLKSFLRRKILMTFTKKAAGEMSVRMLKKLEELIDESDFDQDRDKREFWSLVKENLNYLNILTIHGFCHKLLRQGHWKELPQEIKLLKPLEQRNKLTKLFDQWYEQNSSKTDSLFLSNSQALLESMYQVFSSPELRFMWKNPLSIRSAQEVIDTYFKEYLARSRVSKLFVEGNEILIEELYKKKKWAELIFEFYSLKAEWGALNADNFEQYLNLFNNISKFPSASKEMSDSEIEVLELIKELRSNLNDIADDFLILKSNFEIYQNWTKVFLEVFNYINWHYMDIPGFTFSDLEYYVLSGLQDDSTCIKIRESYDYFIVDEFQDTSSVQYEILLKLLGNDLKKLFAVGDKKQAIYGFRGGELSVFERCSKEIGNENNFFLQNNYRSASQIIKFNNELFEKIFPLGQGFEGADPHSVTMENQEYPSKSNLQGEVVAFKVQLSEEETSSSDIDNVEAQALCAQIKTLLSNNEIGSICVLYRKLMPSKFLLEALQREDFAYISQVKIQLDDDPVANLFLLLVEYLLNHNDQKKLQSTKFLLRNLLQLLRIKSDDLDLYLDHFRENQKLYGLKISFHRFLYMLGVTNSFHVFNSEMVDTVCDITRENLVQIYELLKHENKSEYSFDMMHGNSDKFGKRIIIMSAHASKGLEFDAVLLGGIHTNGRYLGLRDLVGKLPGSFKWKVALGQRQFVKSPFYFLESQLLQQKDFSESKRLLYVACTRAVKKLYYADIWGFVKGEKSALFENKNSWIQAMRIHPAIEVDSSYDFIQSLKKDLSIIHKDSLGLIHHPNLPSMGVSSELSVTRLATLAQCPFKFYLQNVCRLDAQEHFLKLEDDEEVEITYSSMKRGTRLHEVLADVFQGKISIDQVNVDEKDLIEWTYRLAEKYLIDHEVISEKMIKFSLFGQMISGTPDLVFQKKSQRLVVWDFKTGQRVIDSESGYWFQLMCYAYAYGKLNQFSQDQKIEFSLIYLDECLEIKRELTLDEITLDLFSHWKKAEHLYQVSHQHCPHCSFNKICQRRPFPA